jgi:hypothetical protein
LVSIVQTWTRYDTLLFIFYSAIDYSMQKGTEKAPPLNKVKRSGNTQQQPGDGSTSRTGLLPTPGRMELSDRTTIQISKNTKTDLDRIKRESGGKTYDDAIRFLLDERRRLRPSTFGLLSGAGPFVRDEEEDSHRIRP